MSGLHRHHGVRFLLGGALLWALGCGESTSPPATNPQATGEPAS